MGKKKPVHFLYIDKEKCNVKLQYNFKEKKCYNLLRIVAKLTNSLLSVTPVRNWLCMHSKELFH